MKDIKNCKGINKALGYGCGKPTPVKKRVHGLGLDCCYVDWLLNSEAGKEKLNKSILKVQKPRLELEKLEKEKKSESTLKRDLLNTVNAVHSFVKKRDKYKPCISCNAPYKDNFQAGHFYSAYSFLTLKFNLDNIHGQCEQCNLREGGNFENYSLNLPNRIGQERYNELIRLASIDKQFSKVWDSDNLKQIRNQLKTKNNE